MEGTRSLVVVPAEAEEILVRARLLYVQGWHQWEFFTLALREGILGLETGLRRLLVADERPSFRMLISRAVDETAGPLLTVWEGQRADALRNRRNTLVHQSKGATLEWISWARAGLVETVLLLNLAAARKAGMLPSTVLGMPSGS
jgi:hypothetical protein